MHKMISILGLSVAVAGCAYDAGYEVDSGTFGNATLNNAQIQTGAKSYVQVLGERFAREVPDQVNFAFNSSQLDPTAQQILRQQADWIKQFPEVRFKVFGHTDKVGSPAYNQRLGLRRAQAVVTYLTRQGISRNRLEAVSSLGEREPLINTPDRDRRNRRTVTEVTGFIKRNQTLDGKYAQVIYREYIKSAEPPTTLSADDSSAFEN
ncbi:OmpA family protein [Ruegeria sp. 2012CJ41-6]|uniref:OmpA family protein n=1 Tax=Ruegeria spongiae TaxID=2942209 RepID=A0ABT0Q636_9RHOB|nr:OmpA family protein [Ruegeria spongiae]MCL6285339.1 OmpA family protein [Ruegeria spongiae]